MGFFLGTSLVEAFEVRLKLKFMLEALDLLLLHSAIPTPEVYYCFPQPSHRVWFVKVLTNSLCQPLLRLGQL